MEKMARRIDDERASERRAFVSAERDGYIARRAAGRGATGDRKCELMDNKRPELSNKSIKSHARSGETSVF